jgi:hypothetical protein
LPVVTTTADLAADLGVDEGDITLLLARLTDNEPDLAGHHVPDDAASFIRRLLDPHGERTAPTGLYWPSADQQPPRAYGLGGPRPHRPRRRLPAAIAH